MTADDVRTLLRAEIEKAGSQNKYAEAHGVDQSCLSNFLSGRQKAGPSILNALGLRIVYVYEPLKHSCDKAQQATEA